LANPRGGWHYRRNSKETKPAEDLMLPINIASGRPKTSDKPPSKQRHDCERSIKRDRIFQMRRVERARLFGYVRLVDGEVLSIDEALLRLQTSASEDPNNRGGILPQDVAEWHQPEAVRDVLDSVGEIDAVSEYPALGIFSGVVLIDQKLRHRDPALRK
jgi:hypothetical protein